MSGVAAAPPSPQPRRITTPRWLDLRLVLGVLLVLVSVLIGAKVVAGADRTHQAVAVTRDLAAGTVVTADDVRLARVRLPNHGDGVYLSSMDDAVGKRLTRAVSRGELLPAASVAGLTERTTVVVPLGSGTAPQLRAGQRIVVWVSTSRCASVVLLPDVVVQSVHADSGGSFGAASGAQNVVVSVEPAAAVRVVQAQAIEGAKLRAGVLVGRSDAASDAPSAAAPDLAGCASPTPTR